MSRSCSISCCCAASAAAWDAIASFKACTSAAVMVAAAAAFLCLGGMLVWATSDVVRNTSAHIFPKTFITLSFLTKLVQRLPNLQDQPGSFPLRSHRACDGLVSVPNAAKHNSEHHRIRFPVGMMFWFYRRSVTGRLQTGEFLMND